MENVNIYVADPSLFCDEIKKIRDAKIKGLKLYFIDNKDVPDYCRRMKDVKFLPCNIGDTFSFNWDKRNRTAICTNKMTPFLNCIDSIVGCKVMLGNYCSDIFFKDNIRDNSLPNKFYRIPSFIDFNGLKTYCFKNSYLTFSLNLGYLFEKTNKREQGQSIYKELNTGYYWYLDNLHKDHYEVFDKNCNHIGEASMEGILDRNKAEPGRTITL